MERRAPRVTGAVERPHALRRRGATRRVDADCRVWDGGLEPGAAGARGELRTRRPVRARNPRPGPRPRGAARAGFRPHLVRDLGQVGETGRAALVLSESGD